MGIAFLISPREPQTREKLIKRDLEKGRLCQPPTRNKCVYTYEDKQRSKPENPCAAQSYNDRPYPVVTKCQTNEQG